MPAESEILPAPLTDFRLPPGLEMPRNVVLTEQEAADFLREPVARLQKRRFNGTGPTFIRRSDETWGARYLIWDLLAWLIANRHCQMPRRRARAD